MEHRVKRTARMSSGGDLWKRSLKKKKERKQGKVAATSVEHRVKCTARMSSGGDLWRRSLTKKKKKERKQVKVSYSAYIRKMLKLVHPDMQLSSVVMSIMDEFVHEMFERIATEASRQARTNKKTTLSIHHIEAAVRLIISGEHAENAVFNGSKAVLK